MLPAILVFYSGLAYLYHFHTKRESELIKKKTIVKYRSHIKPVLKSYILNSVVRFAQILPSRVSDPSSYKWDGNA